MLSIILSFFFNPIHLAISIASLVFWITAIFYAISQFFGKNQEPAKLATRDIVELSTCRVFEEGCNERPGRYIYLSDLEVKSTGKKFRARVVYSFKEEV
jgi:hypothetical protein